MAIYKLGCVFQTEHVDLVTGERFRAFELGVIPRERKGNKRTRTLVTLVTFDPQRCRRSQVLLHLPTIGSEVTVTVSETKEVLNRIAFLSEKIVMVNQFNWFVHADGFERARQYRGWGPLMEALEGFGNK